MLGKYLGLEGSSQALWKPALLSLTSSFAATARLTADTAQQPQSPALWIWFHVVESMQNSLLPLMGAKATKAAVLLMPGMFSSHEYHVLFHGFSL